MAVHTHLTAIFQYNQISQYQNVSILDFTGAKDDGGGGDNCRYKTCKAPTSSFSQARCLSCRPYNSVKALRGK